jgi:hypothetical protein
LPPCFQRPPIINTDHLKDNVAAVKKSQSALNSAFKNTDEICLP